MSKVDVRAAVAGETKSEAAPATAAPVEIKATRFLVSLPPNLSLEVEATDQMKAFEEFKKKLGIISTVHSPEVVPLA